VIALPFFLTMTFTGLAIFFYIVLPSGMKNSIQTIPFSILKKFAQSMYWPTLWFR